jgi:class 3 adenylate cyclase/pimeloyl-ACP methyl ester carboxylesterase
LWQCLDVRWGEIEYAKAGEHHIAFREIVGDGGDLEIIMATGVFFPMESLAGDPVTARLVEGLASLGRVVLFDRRGVALSDPVSDWDTPLLEQWADDLAAVIIASGCDRPVVFSWHGPGLERMCAIRYPELISRLILFNPSTTPTEEDSEWIAEWAEGFQRMRAGDRDRNDDHHEPHLSRRDEPVFQVWLDAAGRAGASPSQAARLDQHAYANRPDNFQVRTPTLVLTRTRADYVVPGHFFQRVADEIPGAELVVLPQGDPAVYGLGVDDVLAEVSQYLLDEVRLPDPERQVAVIMFTDLVGSTRRAAAAGDAQWKRLLDRHDGVSQRAVSRRGGNVIKTTGDGVLALLPSATAAVEAARSIRAELVQDDLNVRIGIHAGEIDRRGDDVSGLAVNVAARIMSMAESGQVLASTVVTLLTDLASFTSVGPKQLKDIDGTWELHTVE